MRLAVGIGAVVVLVGLAVAWLIRLYSVLDHDELVDLIVSIGFVLVPAVVLPGLVLAAVWGLS